VEQFLIPLTLKESGIKIARRVEEVVHTYIDDPELCSLALHLFQNPGKGFRAQYAWEIGELLKGNEDRITPVAVVSELIHTASLIHDDLVDEATIRRGVPALHQITSSKIAVLTGDLLLGLGYAYASLHLTPSSLRLLGPAVLNLASGEILEALSVKGTLSRADLERIVIGKTGALFAWIGGAVACELGREDLSGDLWDYGIEVGKAFQLMDDLGDRLGVLPGKDPYQDERRGVPSLAGFLLEEDPSGRALLKEVERLSSRLETPPLHSPPRVVKSLIQTLKSLAKAYEKRFLINHPLSDEGGEG
jgi:geranylgeranyl pyrophosphate synthase